MPHLFALQGSGNCGKSDTLIRLFQALQTKYPSATIHTLHSGTKDIAVIMRGVKGLVVGIESQGDPYSRLEQSLPAFSAAKCDIIFCACRTRGMTVGWVNSLSAAYSIHFFAQTRVANNQGATNAATAVSLMQQAGI
ncbi:MAG: hypothetical protein PHI11_02220 [Gallionella sp.]|nr:hypothetical protein [Gallionella sp.]